MIIGYAHHDAETHTAPLKAAGCVRVFTDLTQALRFVRSGDTLVSTCDVPDIADGLERRGVALVVLATLANEDADKVFKEHFTDCPDPTTEGDGQFVHHVRPDRTKATAGDFPVVQTTAEEESQFATADMPDRTTEDADGAFKEHSSDCPKTNVYGQDHLPLSEIQLDVLSDICDKSDIDSGQEPADMSRVFAYCRVSTIGQTTENQIREIETAGFAVEKRRTITDTVSGSSAIEQRPGFLKLLDRLERDDVLVVTKLDRLGRNSIDIQATVGRLAEMGVRVHCLALGGTDLTSPAGKMTMGVIAAVAQFERDLLIERTHAGLARAKAEGATLGRPSSLDAEQQETVRTALATGESVSALARQFDTSRQTILRVREAA